jgi:hypothetical protein
MGKARDWGDVGAEGGPGAIRRKGDDPATDIPVDDAPPAQTNGEAYFSEEELRGPPDGPSNWQTPGEGVGPISLCSRLSGAGLWPSPAPTTRPCFIIVSRLLGVARYARQSLGLQAVGFVCGVAWLVVGQPLMPA